MRVAYLDEAGVSAVEPIAIVAGILIHPDFQWHPLERDLSAITADILSEGERDGLILHAKNIFGGKAPFSRERFTIAQRAEIIGRIVSLPAKIGMPIVVGLSRRWVVPDTLLQPSLDEIFEYTRAYRMCLTAIESAISSLPTHEVALIVAEDRNDIKRHVKRLHAALKDKEQVKILGDDVAAFDNIVDTIHLASKLDSPFLQIADSVAWVMQRFLIGRTFGKELYERMTEDRLPFENDFLKSVNAWHTIYPPVSSNATQGKYFISALNKIRP